MGKKWCNKGFTLIETVISLAIIGIIIVSFLTMFSSGYSTIFSMGSKTEATRIAQEVIDYHYENALITEPSGLLPPMPTNISPRYLVTRTTSSTINDLTEVIITVSYRNNSRSVTLTALIP